LLPEEREHCSWGGAQSEHCRGEPKESCSQKKGYIDAQLLLVATMAKKRGGKAKKGKGKKGKTKGKKKGKKEGVAQPHSDVGKLAKIYDDLCDDYGISPCASLVYLFGNAGRGRKQVDMIHIDTTLNDFESWIRSRHGEDFDEALNLAEEERQCEHPEEMDNAENGYAENKPTAVLGEVGYRGGAVRLECVHCGGNHSRGDCLIYFGARSLPQLPELVPCTSSSSPKTSEPPLQSVSLPSLPAIASPNQRTPPPSSHEVGDSKEVEGTAESVTEETAETDRSSPVAVPLMIHAPLGTGGAKMLRYTLLGTGYGDLQYDTLHTLKLNGCSLKDMGVQHIGALLDAQSSIVPLEHLELQNNDIGEEGCHNLGRVLEHNKALKTLRLDRNKDIDCAGVGALCAGLMAKGNLSCLTLAHCSIGARGASSIRGMLRAPREGLAAARGRSSTGVGLPAMELLELQGNPLTAAGLCILCKGMQSASSLRHINLGDTGFGVSNMSNAALVEREGEREREREREGEIERVLMQEKQRVVEEEKRKVQEQFREERESHRRRGKGRMQMSAAAKERKAAEKIRAEEEIAAKEEADKQEVVRIAGLLQRFYTEREIVYGEGHCTKVAMRIKPVEIERLLMMKYGASPDLMAAQRAEAKAKKTAEEQAKREAEQKVEEAENAKHNFEARMERATTKVCTAPIMALLEALNGNPTITSVDIQDPTITVAAARLLMPFIQTGALGVHFEAAQAHVDVQTQDATGATGATDALAGKDGEKMEDDIAMVVAGEKRERKKKGGKKGKKGKEGKNGIKRFKVPSHLPDDVFFALWIGPKPKRKKGSRTKRKKEGK
jgi:hypothetical protein